MAVKNQSFLKTKNRDFNNILDSMTNLDDHRMMAPTSYNIGRALSSMGMNPIWAFNFGDPSVAASATLQGAHASVLTPVGTLYNLSRALEYYANQTDELTIAESTAVLGQTAVASTSVEIAAGATTVFVPDHLGITRLTGNLPASITWTASTTDYQNDEQALVMFKGNNVFTASQVLTLTTHADAELNAEGTEAVESGAGTDVMVRSTAPADGNQTIILTASGADTTVLPGSYIYITAENNTDALNAKICLRTTGGTIAVTYGS